MLYSDVIAETAKLLGLKEGEEMTDEQEEKLLLGLKIVVDELARSYFPLTRRETLEPVSGKIAYSKFEKTPTAIVKVELGGKTLPFARLYDGIEVKADKPVAVTYGFLPSTPTASGETEWQDASVPMRIICFGTATEYCLMYGLEADAAMWDKRYRDALEDITLLAASGRRIPARRWSV